MDKKLYYKFSPGMRPRAWPGPPEPGWLTLAWPGLAGLSVAWHPLLVLVAFYDLPTFDRYRRGGGDRPGSPSGTVGFSELTQKLG